MEPGIVAIVLTGTGPDARAATLASLEGQDVEAITVGATDSWLLASTMSSIKAQGDIWVMSLRAGDLLAPGAVQAYRAAAAQTAAGLIYADDDLVDARGRRSDPHFKPEWNAELFRHFDFVTDACIMRASRSNIETLDSIDAVTRMIERRTAEDMPVHLPLILHHRRQRHQPNLPSITPFAETDWPLVSVIVPTRDRLELLRNCLEGLARTDYPQIEVLVVDNNSSDPATLAYLDGLDPEIYRVLRHPGAFNYSTINNRAAGEAMGQVLCLLNNDVEVISPGWLKSMVVQAKREEVGAVGAQLLYPDGRIQHAGIVLGVGGGAAHAHRLVDSGAVGYFHRHALPQFVSAVTGACLVVQKERFLAAGGFDDQSFAVAFNDVDLCLRLNERGWQTLYEPRAQLIHHESVSRGFDRDPVGAKRFAGELAALKRRWKTDVIVDPFHHRQLSRYSEHFVVAL